MSKFKPNYKKVLTDLLRDIKEKQLDLRFKIKVCARTGLYRQAHDYVTEDNQLTALTNGIRSRMQAAAQRPKKRKRKS